VKFAAGTETGTLAVTHTTGVSAWQILGFSGVDNTTPVDAGPSTVDVTASAMVITGITVATDQAALVVAGSKNISTVTATPPAGFTETGDRVTGTASIEIAYKLGQGTGATGDQTITWSSGSQVEVGLLFALKPAGAPPAGLRKILSAGSWVTSVRRLWNGSAWA
jgi:hypothetical protein